MRERGFDDDAAHGMALELLDWHGGQNTALYSVGTCLLAEGVGGFGRLTVTDLINARLELAACRDDRADILSLRLARVGAAAIHDGLLAAEV